MNTIAEFLLKVYCAGLPECELGDVEFVETIYHPDQHIFTTVLNVELHRRKQDRRVIHVHFNLIDFTTWLSSPHDKRLGGLYQVSSTFNRIEE